MSRQQCGAVMILPILLSYLAIALGVLGLVYDCTPWLCLVVMISGGVLALLSWGYLILRATPPGARRESR